MTLTMELLVQLNQFKILKDSLVELKEHDLHLIHLLDTMIHLPEEEGSGFFRQKALEETRHKIRSRMQYAWQALEYFDKLTGRTSLFSEQLYQTLISNTTRPFSDCVQGLPRLTHSLSESLGKHIQLAIKGEDVMVDRHLLEGIEQCLNHIVRNACDHGIEVPEERIRKSKRPLGSIQIRAYHHTGFLMIEAKDDGRGVDVDTLKKRVVELGLIDVNGVQTISQHKLLEYIFLPGVSTAKTVSEVSGRGVGLDVVRYFLEKEQGSIHIHTSQEEGTRFLLQLPLMRSVLKTLVARVGLGLYAFNKEGIEAVFALDEAKLQERSGSYTYIQGDQSFPVVHLGELLKLSAFKIEPGLKVIIVRSENSLFGLVVEAIEGEHSLLVQPLHPKLGKIPCVSASSFNAAGEPIFILDTGSILSLLSQRFEILPSPASISLPLVGEASLLKEKTLLWVDDSPVIRERVAPQVFASRPYRLITAKDGVEALNFLGKQAIDLLITDLDMPNLNGEVLIQTVRKNLALSGLPILIVSSKNQEEHPALAQENFMSKNHIFEATFLQSIELFLNV